MECVDIEKVTKDDMSFPPQSQWDSYTVRVHGIIVGLCVWGVGGCVCVWGVGGCVCVWGVGGRMYDSYSILTV